MKKSIQENETVRILKYKFAIKKHHIYGCCVIFVNVKTETILNISCIVSLNPLIYEIDIDEGYKKVENIINKYKLSSKGSFELIKKVCVGLYENEKELVDAIQKEKIHIVDNIFVRIFDADKENIKSLFKIEKLKSEESFENVSYKLEEVINRGIDKFFIKTKPVIDEKKGVSVEKIKTKDEVLCEIIDKREIVKYIMQTLFSKEVKFLYFKVHEINLKNKKYYEITCSITPIIFTKFIVDKKQKIVINK
ncbi:MAG: hypothetical protein RMJ67_03260 [Elusimicrobiota bacterium]|nr:hypothetical protein [Endomicrobiia bacterium]MDW8165513.1 hypothetical protein [Elusimicrobiota bacterium]